MEINLDPLTATMLFGIITVGCGWLLGKWHGEGNKEDTVNSTIDYLIESGFMKAEEDEEGNITLIPYPIKKTRTKRG